MLAYKREERVWAKHFNPLGLCKNLFKIFGKSVHVDVAVSQAYKDFFNGGKKSGIKAGVRL